MNGPSPRLRRLRSWATTTSDFPLRRAATWSAALVVIVMVTAATTLTANADPGGGSGPFSAIDLADSKGIRVSQYELSISTGSVLDPIQMWLSLRLITVWNFYRVAVALVAYVFDWTLSMTWLDAIVTPLDTVARRIRDELVSPIGLAGVMLLLSAVVGGIRIVYGKTGRGIWDIISAAIVATAVTALLVSPVSSITGEPLTKVRNAGIGIAAMIDGKSIDGATIDGDPKSQLKPAPVLVDAFIRPAHGLINYGVNFTDNQKCTPAYDKALKDGPHFSPSSDDQRKAVARCDQTLGAYAEKQSVYAASFGMGAFVLSGVLVGLTILTACVLLFIAVMMLGWSLVKLVITGVIGIGPGDVRGPMIRNACDALTSLLYVGVSTVVLAIILALIQNAFAADLGNPMGRFLLVDVVLIGSFVIVIQTWSAHRRGAQSWTDKVLTRLKQTAPKPTVASRLGGWLKAPAGGEAAKYGGLAGDGYGYGSGVGGAASPFGIRRMVRPITHSNAFQLARLGVIAGAATGGAGLAAGKLATRVVARSAGDTIRGTRMLADAANTGTQWAAFGVRHTADSAQQLIRNSFNTRRNGSHRASGESHDEPRVTRAAQARTYLQTHLTAAAADAALALGPAPLAQQRRPDVPLTTQARAEDPQRTAQRTATESLLVRPSTGKPGSPHVPAGDTRSPAPAHTLSQSENRAATKPGPASSSQRGDQATPESHKLAMTLESTETAVQRVQQMVQPADNSRRHPTTPRPMRR